MFQSRSSFQTISNISSFVFPPKTFFFQLIASSPNYFRFQFTSQKWMQADSGKCVKSIFQISISISRNNWHTTNVFCTLYLIYVTAISHPSIFCALGCVVLTCQYFIVLQARLTLLSLLICYCQQSFRRARKKLMHFCQTLNRYLTQTDHFQEDRADQKMRYEENTTSSRKSVVIDLSLRTFSYLFSPRLQIHAESFPQSRK